MEYTKGFRLSKPGGNDYIDINVFNVNAEIIDAALTESGAHAENGGIHVNAAQKSDWNARETPDGARRKADAALALALAADHAHANKPVLDGVTAALTAGWNGAVSHVGDAVRHITAAERTTWNGMAPSGRKVNNKPLTTDITLTAADVGARPANWTPGAGDTGAVPASRKVNNKPLSTDITLTADDVAARPSNWNPAIADCAGTLAVAKGGTGATTAALARNALGLGNTTGALPVANGDTGIANLVGTDYGTTRVRGIYAGTGDMTAGTTALANGVIYLRYE